MEYYKDSKIIDREWDERDDVWTHASGLVVVRPVPSAQGEWGIKVGEEWIELGNNIDGAEYLAIIHAYNYLWRLASERDGVLPCQDPASGIEHLMWQATCDPDKDGLPFLKDYAGDVFFHDFGTLAKNSGRFVWILRELGSSLIPLNLRGGNDFHEEGARLQRALGHLSQRNHYTPNPRFFLGDNSNPVSPSLEEVDQLQAALACEVACQEAMGRLRVKNHQSPAW